MIHPFQSDFHFSALVNFVKTLDTSQTLSLPSLINQVEVAHVHVYQHLLCPTCWTRPDIVLISAITRKFLQEKFTSHLCSRHTNPTPLNSQRYTAPLNA